MYESGETGCKPTIESHDDKRKFMVFRLIKPRAKEKAIQSGLSVTPVDNRKKPPLLICMYKIGNQFIISVCILYICEYFFDITLLYTTIQ